MPIECQCISSCAYSSSSSTSGSIHTLPHLLAVSGSQECHSLVVRRGEDIGNLSEGEGVVERGVEGGGKYEGKEEGRERGREGRIDERTDGRTDGGRVLRIQVNTERCDSIESGRDGKTEKWWRDREKV